jgi:hypothetical protein
MSSIRVLVMLFLFIGSGAASAFAQAGGLPPPLPITITFDSNPQGADFTFTIEDSVISGVTPATKIFTAAKPVATTEITITFTLSGYKECKQPVKITWPTRINSGTLVIGEEKHPLGSGNKKAVVVKCVLERESAR